MFKVTLTNEQTATILAALSMVEDEMTESAGRFFASGDEKAACQRVISKCRDAQAAVREGRCYARPD